MDPAERDECKWETRRDRSIVKRRSLLVVMHAAPADEICSVIDTAFPDVLRLLRIRTKRTRAVDHFSYPVRGDDSLGRHPVLDPVLQRCQQIERVWARSRPRAMVYAWRHEKPQELVGIVAEALDDFLVVRHRAQRGEGGISPALPHDELATGGFESGQVGIGGINENARGSEQRRVSVEIERQRIVAGTKDEIAEE